MTPLFVPAELPQHARQYLAQLDVAVTNAVGSLALSSESYRTSARMYREVGQELQARDAEKWAEVIELDPRLYVAGCMRNATPDGTAKYFLHQYIDLLQAQAKLSTARAA